jgi:hypothetical protein
MMQWMSGYFIGAAYVVMSHLYWAQVPEGNLGLLSAVIFSAVGLGFAVFAAVRS